MKKYYVQSKEPLELLAELSAHATKAVVKWDGNLVPVPVDALVEEGRWESYADGTSGQQREASAAAEKYRSNKQKPTLKIVEGRGPSGITVIELRDLTGWHHGKASSALSNLHRQGFIVRLKEQRNRAGIYVTPEMVQGRETVPHRSNRAPASAE